MNVNDADAAVYAKLHGTAGLTALLASAGAIYNLQAPENAAYPLVVFGLQAGTDDNDNPHRARQLVYLAKGVVSDVQATGASKTMKDAGDIDAQIDAALHRATLTGITGFTNFWSVRESDVRYQEDAPGGRRFYHAGGLYRVRIAA